jgi:hypothetical protein
VMIERTLCSHTQPYHLPAMIYCCSTQDSNHRTLVVDTFINVMSRTEWARNESQPKQFLFDVVKAIGPKLDSGMNEQTYNQFFNLDDTCKYHDHGPDKPCYKTKPAFRF